MSTSVKLTADMQRVLNEQRPGFVVNPNILPAKFA